MLSVIIPIFNEKDNMPELIRRIENTLRNREYEIIFMDDSTDDTPQVITRLIAEKKRFRLIHRDNVRGLASAVLEGFGQARGDIWAVMDGDLQHPPELLEEMLLEIKKGADIVIPSRFIQGGSDGGLNWFRKLASATARYLGKILLKSLRPVSDPTGGVFMLRKEVIDGQELAPVGWKILMEILVLGDYHTLTEIPYPFNLRNAGKSKFSFKIELQYLYHLLSLIHRSPSDRRFYRFCLIGVSGVLIDMLMFAWLGSYSPALNVNGRAVVSALTAMISNFVLNNFFTWSDQLPRGLRWNRTFFLTNFYRFGKYLIASSLGILVKSLILFLVYNLLGTDKYLANLLGIICATLSNYSFNQYWVWGNVKFKPVFYRRSAENTAKTWSKTFLKFIRKRQQL